MEKIKTIWNYQITEKIKVSTVVYMAVGVIIALPYALRIIKGK